MRTSRRLARSSRIREEEEEEMAGAGAAAAVLISSSCRHPNLEGVLLTQRCSQPEGNLKNRQYKVESHFLLPRCKFNP